MDPTPSFKPFLSFLQILFYPMSHRFFSALFNLLSQPSLPLFHTLLPCTVDVKYLKSTKFFISTSCNLTVPLGALSFTHMRSVVLTFISFLSRTYLHLSRFSFTSSLLSLQVTVSSAIVIVHGDSCPNSSVSLSQKGLKADCWCQPTFILNSCHTNSTRHHCHTALLHVYISLTYFSLHSYHTRLPHTKPNFLY